MAQRDEIIRYANELLEIHRFPEYGTPGLQVLGADEVTKIARGRRRRSSCSSEPRPQAPSS